MSIRLKITLWFAAALFIVIAMTYAVILSVSREVIQKTVRDTLLETVENNVDEIEYYKDITGIDLNTETDHFIIYKDADVGTKKCALPFRYRRQELLIPVSENKKQVDG